MKAGQRDLNLQYVNFLYLCPSKYQYTVIPMSITPTMVIPSAIATRAPGLSLGEGHPSLKTASQGWPLGLTFA